MTTVHLDPALTDAPVTEKFGTTITVTTTGGVVHTATVSAPHGAPADPVTDAELLAKFHALTDRVTDAARATAIADAVLRLDELDDISILTDLLAAPVAGALD